MRIEFQGSLSVIVTVVQTILITWVLRSMADTYYKARNRIETGNCCITSRMRFCVSVFGRDLVWFLMVGCLFNQTSLAQETTSKFDPRFDILLRGGTVIDGTGSIAKLVEVAIQNEKILILQPDSRITAEWELDSQRIGCLPRVHRFT